MKTKEKNEKFIPFDKKKANQAMKGHGLKIKTILLWEEQGFMPKRYFEKKDMFSIGGKTILELRVSKGLSQVEFVDKFNTMFSMDLSTVSLSTWENGKSTPRKYYQNMITEFYQKHK